MKPQPRQPKPSSTKPRKDYDYNKPIGKCVVCYTLSGWLIAAELPDRVASDVAKVVYACLEPRPADRPLPHELAEALQPALERAPRGRLAGFKVR